MKEKLYNKQLALNLFSFLLEAPHLLGVLANLYRYSFSHSISSKNVNTTRNHPAKNPISVTINLSLYQPISAGIWTFLLVWFVEPVSRLWH